MNQRLAQIIFLFIILFLGLLSYRSTPQASLSGDVLNVAYMDVGQGDAILLTTPHRKHILIDGGPDSSVLTRLGSEMRFNERTFDLVIVSHNHADHITGLNRVLDRYDVERMWISGAIHTTNEYLRMLEQIKSNGIPTEVVWQGKTADIDGVHFEVMHPLVSQEGLTPEGQHDATIVVRVTYGQKHFLFTGDIDEQHEQAMIQAGLTLQADVLKVPHHGAASGLALNFLSSVNPAFAVIQVGKDNRFAHPAPSIIKKLEERDIPIFRNDIHGTVHATTNGSDLRVK